MNSAGKVAVGLSGGVDSAVTAALLKARGHGVVGVTMRIWDGRVAMPDTGRSGCYGPGEARDLEQAAMIAARLGIEHHVISLADEYHRVVLDYFRREYSAGRTPNPCVVCNRYVKFGMLPDRLRAAGVAFDRFATGHYARVRADAATGCWRLLRGVDPDKDQSYFLHGLNQAQLARLLLPLGDMTKPRVIAYARDHGLADLAARSESQDFIESDDYGVLFDEQARRPGPIVDEQGRRLGMHRGIVHYTVGQREGLGVAARERMYVKALLPATNTVVLAARPAVMHAGCIVESVHWIDGAPPPAAAGAGLECRVRPRYRHSGAPARVTVTGAGCVRVDFTEPQFAITPGQAAVFYDGDVVLGGGRIASNDVTA